MHDDESSRQYDDCHMVNLERSYGVLYLVEITYSSRRDFIP